MPGTAVQPSIPSRRNFEVISNETESENFGDDSAAVPTGSSSGRVEHPWENDMNEYRMVAPLGSGAYGTVYAANHRVTGIPVAIKKISVVLDEEGVPQSVVREVASLKQIGDHPNVARLLSLSHGLKNESELYINLIFERCDWDLFAYLSNIPTSLPEIQIRHFARQIITGLDFLHSNNIVHRDLKPQNVLVNMNGSVKLTDFGLARAFSGTAFTPVVVTLWYRSPEVILQCSYISAVDIWSAACIFAEMYTRTALFPGKTEREQLVKIFDVLGLPSASDWPSESKVRRESFPHFSGVGLERVVSRASAEAVQVLAAMLTYNTKVRPSARKVLSFPYFTGFTLVPTYPAS